MNKTSSQTDEWIPHNGNGINPVAHDVMVIPKQRRGFVLEPRKAGLSNWRWYGHNDPCDVVAYKLVEPDWIPWAGNDDGKCPLPDGTKFKVRFEDGDSIYEKVAPFYVWDKRSESNFRNIIAYRILSTPKKEWSLQSHMQQHFGVSDFVPHRLDGWTEEMLSGGWRPFYEGELKHTGSELTGNNRGWTKINSDINQPTCDGFYYRTKRSLPTPALEPPKWSKGWCNPGNVKDYRVPITTPFPPDPTQPALKEEKPWFPAKGDWYHFSHSDGTDHSGGPWKASDELRAYKHHAQETGGKYRPASPPPETIPNYDPLKILDSGITATPWQPKCGDWYQKRTCGMWSSPVQATHNYNEDGVERRPAQWECDTILSTLANPETNKQTQQTNNMNSTEQAALIGTQWNCIRDGKQRTVTVLGASYNHVGYQFKKLFGLITKAESISDSDWEKLPKDKIVAPNKLHVTGLTLRKRLRNYVICLVLGATAAQTPIVRNTASYILVKVGQAIG